MTGQAQRNLHLPLDGRSFPAASFKRTVVSWLSFKRTVVSAGWQGCMNNVTFGDESFGYYETIAVHTLNPIL